MVIDGITTDIDGIPRPLDGDGDGIAAPDIGAYEYIAFGADSDGDGLSDIQELILLDTDPTLVSSDDDPASDYNETIAGTDPLDGSDWFHVTNCTACTDGFLVEWESVSGRTYSIWHTASLTNDFTQLTNSIAYPASSCVVETGGTNGFFRIEVELAD
jgi:hypothetical protein